MLTRAEDYRFVRPDADAFQGGAHPFGGRQLGVVAAILVPATFAIDAVERADFSFFGQQIDP